MVIECCCCCVRVCGALCVCAGLQVGVASLSLSTYIGGLRTIHLLLDDTVRGRRIDDTTL